MKGKIALVAALATAVTVGGVYATWSFAESQVQNASTTVNVAMTGTTATTEKGTLSVTVMGAGGFTLAVDDVDSNHKPDIKKEGVVTITFTPALASSQDVKTNGIDVQLVISYAPYVGGATTLEEWKYENTQIFTIPTDPIHLSKADATKGEGVFTWTLDPEEINIDLTEAMQAVVIDSMEKYNDMNTELAKGHFVLTVSECATTHTPED